MSATAGYRNGLLTWFALAAPIGAWAVHVVSLAALAEWACADHAREWVLHLITAATLAVAATGLAAGWRLRTSARHATEDSGDAAGRTRFMGDMAVLVAGVNVALIVLEGAFVLVMEPCS